MDELDYGDVSLDESFQALTEAYEDGYDNEELVENIDRFISHEGQPGVELLLEFALENQAFDIITLLEDLGGVNVVDATMNILETNDVIDVELFELVVRQPWACKIQCLGERV